MRFECTGCARCCRSLVDPGARGLPADAERLAREGYYPLPREGGLQVWSWERRRMESRGGVRFAPCLAVVADHAEDGRVALPLVYELSGAVCPLVSPDDRCSIYGERPVVCRAYPLLVRSGAFVVSSVCPGAVHPGTPSAVPAAYGASAVAASASRSYPALVVRHLEFLERNGRVTRVRGLDPSHAAALVAEGRVVDVLDLLEREGVASQADLEEACARLGVRYGEGGEARTNAK